MLRNMIFDMGNVLIKYDPAYFIQRTGIADAQDREALLDAVFRSADWALTDAGVIDEDELLGRVQRHLPQRLHGFARELIFHWNEPLEPIAGMEEFIAECKGNGLGVYLLSNASRRQKEYWMDIPGSRYFDGAVVSAFEGCVKPDAKIFRNLLERFHLRAEESLFVDDVQENVAGAERAGLMGFHFTGDVNALRKKVEQLRNT